MQRSPVRNERLEKQLKEEMKIYRRLLQKISTMKTKILCALREEGCSQAAEMLQTPVRAAGAQRCGACVGCITVQKSGPCLSCIDCRKERDCSEHTRLCFNWRQPSTTFVQGSEVMGVSSICNIADYDLGKYRLLLEKLGDCSLEVESILDEFPTGTNQHSNDRFNKDRRERDVRNEDEQLFLIEALVSKYQEERNRLDEVETDLEDEVPDDAINVGDQVVAQYGLLSRTNTHYAFDGAGRLPGGLDITQGGGMELPGENPVEPPSPGLDRAIGVGLGWKDDQGGDILQVSEEQPPVDVSVTPRPVIPVVVTIPSTVSPFYPVDDRIFPIQPVALQPTGAKPKVSIGLSTEASTRSNLHRSVLPVIVTSATGAIKTPVSSAIMSTVSTVVTRTSPSEATSSGGSDQASATPSRSPTRRRTASESRSAGLQFVGVESEREESERIKTLVAVRSQSLAQDISELLSRANSATGVSIRWLEQETNDVKNRLDLLEELESAAWSRVGRIEGSTARTLRMTRWTAWKTRQTDQIRRVKSLSWELCQREAREDRAGPSTSCGRSAGHVEKVKLPTFTGNQEDFAEFKSQFRELCRGERYTPILEMAQLDSKQMAVNTYKKRKRYKKKCILCQLSRETHDKEHCNVKTNKDKTWSQYLYLMVHDKNTNTNTL